MNRRVAALTPSDRPRYIGPLCPIVFPEDAEVPESQLHLELRTLLYQLLSDYLGLECTVGSDQFVYFDAADPRQCVAPDVYVRLEPRSDLVRSWKVWERGAPELAVEIISESDAEATDWDRKLRAYRSLGVRELVRFDPEATEATRLRIWDRVGERLMERELTDSPAPSSALNLHWALAPADGHAIALRITDPEGLLVPTRKEAFIAEAEARKAEAEARMTAEARIRELEAELQRMKKRG